MDGKRKAALANLYQLISSVFIKWASVSEKWRLTGEGLERALGLNFRHRTCHSSWCVWSWCILHALFHVLFYQSSVSYPKPLKIILAGSSRAVCMTILICNKGHNLDSNLRYNICIVYVHAFSTLFSTLCNFTTDYCVMLQCRQIGLTTPEQLPCLGETDTEHFNPQRSVQQCFCSIEDSVLPHWPIWLPGP